MAWRPLELVSLFFYKICNSKRSDYEIEEHVEEVDELKAEAEPMRLRTIIQTEEAEHKRLRTLLEKEEAGLERLRTISENKSEEEKKKANKDLFLPWDVVLVILSRLALKENIRSSAVCKTWCEIAASVRVRDPPCWLLYFDRLHNNGVSYGFYDPVEKKKTKAMSLPWLSKNLLIVSSKDGWLLMRKVASVVNLFFFNPFTRERMDLPILAGSLMEFAFSCAPTKKDCLVFGIDGISSYGVKIGTWRPGATTWVNQDFPVFPSQTRHTKNVLYSDGLFYLASEFALGIFDPCARTWNVLPVHRIPSPSHKGHIFSWMTEYEEQIYLVDASSAEPMVFRLNLLQLVWEKKDTLDGSSIFVSDASCVMACGHTGSMSNIVYVWNSYINARRPTKHECSFKWNRPYKYSLYSRSLCEDPEGYYFEYQTSDLIDGVWIMPPDDISIHDFSILDPSNAINTSPSI